MVLDARRSNSHRPTILIADDDAAMRALLRASLERAHYDVRDVEDGRGVLAEVAARMPDVALIDIGMPVMDGLSKPYLPSELIAALQRVLVREGHAG